MAHPVDEIDRRIIALLQADGRRPNVDIAAALGLAEGAVRKRLGRLLSQGTIRITALVDPAQVGYRTEAVIMVQVDLSRLEEVARRLASLPEVQSVAIATGNWDIILNAVFPDDHSLLCFLQDKVAGIPGIRRTETSHILKRLKHIGDWELPLQAAVAPTEIAPEMLRQADLLSGLTDDELAYIIHMASMRTYEAGARIFVENEEAREIYIVHQGRVALLVDIGQGRQAVMGTVGRHESFGWPALVPPFIHCETARCVERTTVIAIPTAGLRELCLANCTVCYTIMEKVTSVISSRLKDARFQLIHMLTGGEQRIPPAIMQINPLPAADKVTI